MSEENERPYEQAQEEIAERKRALEVLRESEERYRRLVELSFEAIVIHREGKVVYINAAGAQLFGASSPEELVGRPILDFVHPDYLEIVKARVLQVAEGRTASLIEEKLIRLDGTSVDAEVMGTPITYQGQPAVQVVIRDITERKQADEALAHERDLLQALMDNIPDTIYFKDTASRFTRINRAQAQTMGVNDPAEAIGKTDFDFFTVEHARDAYADEQEIVKSGQPLIDKVERIRRADGQFRWVSATKVPIRDREGRVTGVVGISRDITERKRAGEEFQRLKEFNEGIVQSVAEGIIMGDAEGYLTFVNPAAATMLGYTPDELLGQHWTIAVPPDQQPIVQAADERRVRGEADRYELELIRKDDTRVPILVSGSPRFEEGHFAGTLAVFTDITERKQAEEALRVEKAYLEQLFESAPEAVVLVDNDSRVLRANSEFTRTFGYTLDEVLGRSVDELLAPSDLREEAISITKRVAEGERVALETVRQRKEGTLVNVSILGTPIKVDGGQVAVYAIYRDITERKQAEAERERLLTVLERRSTQLQTAAEVSKSASTILDPEELMNQAVNLIQERFDFYYVGIFLVDEAGEYAVLRAGTGEAGRQMLEAGHELVIGGKSMIGWSVANARARIVLDVGREAVRFDNPLLPETRSEMALPLIRRGRCIGALTVQSTEEVAFSEEDIAVLQTMADQLAIAIENARLYEAAQREITERKRAEEALRERATRLELIARVGQRTTSIRELDELLHQAVSLISDTFGYYNVIILLVDGNEIVLRAATLPSLRPLKGRVRLRIGSEGITGWAAGSGEPLLVPDVSLETRYHAVLEEMETKSELAVPIKLKGAVIGVLDVQSAEHNTFSQADVFTLQTVADQLAIAIENARLFATEQQRTAELAHALEQQQELDRLKDEFIQNASHELRIPLAIAWGYAELLDSGELGELQPDQREPVAIIARRVRMLGKMVDDLMAIQEVETRELSLEPVDLVNLVHMLLGDFQVAADQAGLSLTAEVASNVPQVSGDPDHLRRMLDNLLDNAVKFTLAGGSVTMRLWQDGMNVVLKVTDTGIGIPHDQLDRIFERFYQVDGSMTRRYGGTGLGLALVEEIVEAHEGKISVESKVGQGSTFTVTLPIYEG